MHEYALLWSARRSFVLLRPVTTTRRILVLLGNHSFSYTGVYDKDSRQQEEPSRVDTVSSTPISGSVTDLNIGNIVANRDVGHNNFYKIKEAYPMPNPGAAGCFDLGHLRMHL